MASRPISRALRATAVTAAVAGALASHALKTRALDARAGWADTEGFVVLPPPEAARALSLGYRQLLADVTFARALVYRQDTRRDVTEYRFLNRFIDNIIALDPGFKRVYAWAHYAVMFKNETLTDDEIRNSIKYLEIAMAAFPDDYEFFWTAGLRYYMDLWSDDDEQLRRWRERGAELIEQAMHKPNAPPDLATLAASMRTRLGQKERALSDLREMILLADNPKAQARMIARYKTIAGEEFPDEARRAKRELEQAWKRELPFASPSLYVILGDRPSPVIDFDALANERDLFGADVAPSADEASVAPDGGMEPEDGEGADGGGGAVRR